MLVAAHRDVDRVRAQGIEAGRHLGSARIEGRMRRQHAQAGRRAVDVEAPVRPGRREARHALPGPRLGIAAQAQTEAVQALGDADEGQQRQHGPHDADQPGFQQPGSGRGRRQQRGQHREQEAQRGLAVEVDVDEQHVRRVQAGRTVGVAGDHAVALPRENLLADRHALGPVVGALRLAPIELLAAQHAGQRLAGALVGHRLGCLGAGVGPAEAPHRHLPPAPPVLGASLGPELRNDHPASRARIASITAL